MKKVLYIFCLFLPVFVFGQGKTKTYSNLPEIRFSFSNPDSITIPCKLKEGDFYRVKITGINLSMYSVEIKVRDTSYSKALSFPQFEFEGAADINDKNLNNLNPNDEFISLPIQLTGEEAKMELTFIPKDQKSGLQTYRMPPFKFPKRRMYWSVSSTLYYSGMKTERVGLESVSKNDTAFVSLYKEEPLKGEIGTALLLRGGWYLGKGFGAHISAGTAVSLGEKVKPRGVVGAGLSFGDKHSLTLDGGLSVGYTQVLSKAADFNKYYEGKPEVVIDQLKWSYFIGVGYAFRL